MWQGWSKLQEVRSMRVDTPFKRMLFSRGQEREVMFSLQAIQLKDLKK
jgi:hypothetical protein